MKVVKFWLLCINWLLLIFIYSFICSYFTVRKFLLWTPYGWVLVTALIDVWITFKTYLILSKFTKLFNNKSNGKLLYLKNLLFKLPVTKVFLENCNYQIPTKWGYLGTSFNNILNYWLIYFKQILLMEIFNFLLDLNYKCRLFVSRSFISTVCHIHNINDIFSAIQYYTRSHSELKYATRN